MLQLHDRAKADAAFQRDSPQARVDFAPGTTWVVFSDQVPHAAMGGQHMLEVTPAEAPRPASAAPTSSTPSAPRRPGSTRSLDEGLFGKIRRGLGLTWRR